jgi:hypothetical protein
MSSIVRYCAILLVLAAAVPAFSDDQEKANKELIKVTAMATDATGRGVVSRAVSDTTGVKRPDLVQQRLAMNVNYGDLFVAQELVKSGAKIDDIMAQVKAGKKMGQVANDQHVNWKQIAADAKKLNGKIDDGLYKHFIDDKADKARDADDKYDVAHDNLTADRDVPKPEIEAAADRYQMWKDRALAAGGSHKPMETAEQQAAYSDHARAGGPTGTPGTGGTGSVGSAAPAAGGARTGPN